MDPERDGHLLERGHLFEPEELKRVTAERLSFEGALNWQIVSSRSWPGHPISTWPIVRKSEIGSGSPAGVDRDK